MIFSPGITVGGLFFVCDTISNIAKLRSRKKRGVLKSTGDNRQRQTLFEKSASCYDAHMIEEKLETLVREALSVLDVQVNTVLVESPAEPGHGDYATNAALMYAKAAGLSPRELAANLVNEMMRILPEEVEAIEVAGPGFINFRLSDTYFSRALAEALNQKGNWGHNETLKGKKVIVEYTDPNPFKEFHIGHLMSNAIGESIARIIVASGAETKRACYQGDVGMHVAKAVYGMKQLHSNTESIQAHLSPVFLGKAYAIGANAYESNETAKASIVEINKKIYSREDAEINTLYDAGRAVSLKYFEVIYKKLGTAFDEYFFESKTGAFGKQIVIDNPQIFEKGEGGAVVYRGDEAKGLHTRVFINAEGLPTYEAKELGLAKIKYDTYPYDTSIVITANEVNAYFKVLLDAMSKVFPELAAKTIHISHGMLRLPTGKMSSRTGDVITAEALIADVKEKAFEKIDNSAFTNEKKNEVAEQVAIGAIKYSILRQASNKDIIFDFDQSLSFEGDSGPYLQYAHARALSVLAKAHDKKIDALSYHHSTNLLHKHLLRYPSVVSRASTEREPHYIATYLIELAREFNGYYGNTIILDGAPDEAYKLALVKATTLTLKNGLHLLGIPTPETM